MYTKKIWKKIFRQKNQFLLLLLLTVIQCKQRCSRTTLPLNVTVVDLIVLFILSARRECFLCMKRSFTPRRRSRQYKPLNAQKHLRARNINNIFSIIDSKN
jgi:hypothetical protein